METPIGLLDMPEGVLLHTVNKLGKTTDIVQFRETCKLHRDLLGADAWRSLIKLRWGTVIERNITLEESIRAFAAANNPRVVACDINGAWTDDKGYWCRKRMDGTSGQHRALVLMAVCWLALEASFKVCLRAVLARLACQGTLAM
jgi:hypothetical protein